MLMVLKYSSVKYSSMKYVLNCAVTVAALSAGLWLQRPVFATETLINERVREKQMLAEAIGEAGVIKADVIRLNEQGLSNQVQLSGEETYEISFVGNENERVVAYWDTTDGSSAYDTRLFLFDEAGNEVAQSYLYPTGVNFDEMTGRRRSFLLPETGQYRLVMDLGFYYSADTDAPPRSYALNLRVAPYFERLMISVSERFEEEQYEAALPLLEKAITHQPDHPLPYFARVFILGQLALLNQSEDFLAEVEEMPLSSMYELFQTLTVQEQQQVIADLRRASEGYAAAVARGQVTTEQLEFDPSLLDESANFVETGEASDALRAFVDSFM